MYVHLCRRLGTGTSSDVRTKNRHSSEVLMYVHFSRGAYFTDNQYVRLTDGCEIHTRHLI